MRPLVSDWRNSGSWAEDGAKTATERATGIWQSTLQRYVAPARDPAVVEALDAYVARRKARRRRSARHLNHVASRTRHRRDITSAAGEWRTYHGVLRGPRKVRWRLAK